MNEEWRAWLATAAAAPDGSAANQNPVFCGLPDAGLLQVSGDDAATFLQGQTTCDIAAIAPGHAGVGALCNPKGRVIASFRLLRAEPGFLLLLSADLAEAVRRRLSLYVLRARVRVENLTPDHGVLGRFASENTLAIRDALAPEISAEPGAGSATAGSIVWPLDDGSGRCLIAAETAVARTLWNHWANRHSPAPAEDWRRRDIEAGFPEITAATSEEFLPQMINLDALGGVSFRKGCYTGQEIVTRSQFLGQVKRRMFRLRGRGEAPAPGAVVFDRSAPEPRNIGQVVNAASASGNEFEALAVLATEAVAAAQIRLGAPDGATAEILPLPYSLEAAPGGGT